MQPTHEDTEMVQVVDIHNNPLPPVTRKVMREQGLTHRATYIFIWDRHAQEFYIQKRSMNKKYCPGYYDLTFGGVVAQGETYDENAVRETKEEFGIDTVLEGEGILMRRAFPFYHHHPGLNNSVHGMAYLVNYSGEDYVKQDAEVEQILKLSRAQIEALPEEMVTPDGLQAYRQLVEQTQLLM